MLLGEILVEVEFVAIEDGDSPINRGDILEFEISWLSLFDGLTEDNSFFLGEDGEFELVPNERGEIGGLLASSGDGKIVAPGSWNISHTGFAEVEGERELLWPETTNPNFDAFRPNLWFLISVLLGERC